MDPRTDLEVSLGSLVNVKPPFSRRVPLREVSETPLSFLFLLFNTSIAVESCELKSRRFKSLSGIVLTLSFFQ